MLDYSIECFGFDVAWNAFWLALENVGVDRMCLRDVTYYRVKAMFLNGDADGYIKALKDCGILTDRAARALFQRLSEPDRPVVTSVPRRTHVFKWVPGDHYHVGNSRFDTLNEAIQYIESRGWGYLGVKERFVYRGGGD